MNLFRRNLNIGEWKSSFWLKPCQVVPWFCFSSFILHLYEGSLTSTYFPYGTSGCVTLLTYWSSSIRTGEQKHSGQSGHPDQEKKAKSKLQIPRYQNFWVPARAFEIVFRFLPAISKKSMVLKKEKHFSDKPWLLQ